MKKTLVIAITILLLSLQLIPRVSSNALNTIHASRQKTRVNQYSTSLKTLYPVQRINITFESSNYDLYGEIYYPTNQSQTYPALVFCEGFPAYVSAYSWIPKMLAEQGYVVIIYDPPDLGDSEGFLPIHKISIPRLNAYFRFGSYITTPIHYLKREWTHAASDALTYLMQESPVKDLVNQTNAGIIGHSFGGITATEVVANDQRFNAVVAMSHGNAFTIHQVDIPIQFICGDFDLGLNSLLSTLVCYHRAHAPKEVIMIQLGTHLGFTTAFRSLCPCPPWQKDVIIRYASAWFNHFLKHDPEAYDVITTATDHLSSVFKSRYNFGDGDHILT